MMNTKGFQEHKIVINGVECLALCPPTLLLPRKNNTGLSKKERASLNKMREMKFHLLIQTMKSRIQAMSTIQLEQFAQMVNSNLNKRVKSNGEEKKE